MKTKKISKIIYILILLISIYILLMAFPTSIFATTYTYTNSSNDLPANFDTMYPGYRSLIQTVVAEHPTWTIKLYETGLVWDTVINNENTGHNTTSPKNLVPKNYSDEWICPICGRNTFDTKQWCCASRSAVEYSMDPRNFLNNTYIFEFLQLSNDSTITKEQVEIMASNVAYLNNQAIKDAIWNVAVNNNINPFYIIAKIKQEQGSGASALCSGNGYNGQYVGYYNLFNVGASGDRGRKCYY